MRALVCPYVLCRQGVETSLQAALEKALGKPKEMVSVDIGAKLREAGLECLFPLAAWPPTAAVRRHGNMFVVCGFMYVGARAGHSYKSS